tara:strand:+ start:240 stop:413 length:174 start_codon:yes stop_codon:yes gene_type:complete
MKQYWMQVEYYGDNKPSCDNPLWMLTQGVFRDVKSVKEAYKAQANAFKYKILQVKEA